MARRGRPQTAGRQEMLSATLAIVRDRGVARLTTREVASRAGVSEGSIFYHFGDRQGLLKAVFENALHPLFEFRNDIDASKTTDLDDVREVLAGYTGAVRTFLGEGLDVLVAAHGDAELRDEVGAFMLANDYGPHRGTKAMGSYLAEVQRAGVINADVDPMATAHLLVSETFLRCALPKLVPNAATMIPASQILDTVMRLLEPAS